MSNPFYRARCCDLAEECRAIAALCFPSTEMRPTIRRWQSIAARRLTPRSWARLPTGVSRDPDENAL
jgi:hypothetical protein